MLEDIKVGDVISFPRGEQVRVLTVHSDHYTVIRNYDPVEHALTDLCEDEAEET